MAPSAPPQQKKPRKQTTELVATLNLGRLRLERRNGSPIIYARTFIQGQYKGESTGEKHLKGAEQVATDWYLALKDRVRRGEHVHGRSFADVGRALLGAR